MLSDPARRLLNERKQRLNAPYGARCFLTEKKVAPVMVYLSGLNAPYGARCFLTPVSLVRHDLQTAQGLMRLMMLGAFWHVG